MSSYSGEKWEVAGDLVYTLKDGANDLTISVATQPRDAKREIALAHRIAALPELEAALREIADCGKNALSWCPSCAAWKTTDEICCYASGDIVCEQCSEDVTSSTETKLTEIAAAALKPTEVHGP